MRLSLQPGCAATSMPVPATASQHAALSKMPEICIQNLSFQSAFDQPLVVCMTCWTCGKAISSQSGKCGQCMQAKYCNAKCQRQNWSLHKRFCKSYGG